MMFYNNSWWFITDDCWCENCHFCLFRKWWKLWLPRILSFSLRIHDDKWKPRTFSTDERFSSSWIHQFFKFTFLIIWQFSKTAYFLDQKISNTWLKKAWWKRTLIMPIILVNIFKNWLYFINIYSQTKVKPHVTKKQIPQYWHFTNIIVWMFCSQITNNFILRLIALHTFNDIITIELDTDDRDRIQNFYMEWIALHCSCQI